MFIESPGAHAATAQDHVITPPAHLLEIGELVIASSFQRLEALEPTIRELEKKIGDVSKVGRWRRADCVRSAAKRGTPKAQVVGAET